MRSARAQQSVGTRSRTRIFRQAASRGLEPLETRRLMASIVVNSAADNTIGGDGLTTLREAISAANATPAVEDTITFDLGAGAHTINLGGKLPDLSTNMTIQGPGAELLTVRRDTGGDYQVFTVPAATMVNLAGLTASNGKSGPFDFNGGGVVGNAGTLTINDCVISNGTASMGGGISNFGVGVLTVNNSAIGDNNGGGIFNGAFFGDPARVTLNNCTLTNNTHFGAMNSIGSAIVRNCTISGNHSNFEAGGIFNNGSLLVTGTTFSDNTAQLNGGGIYNASKLDVQDCTFSSNTARNGGAIYIDSSTTSSITRCTISGNAITSNNGYGGVHANFGVTTIRGSIIAGNAAGDLRNNFDSPFSGYNFIGGDPKLAPLADNGGPTKTMALLPDSPCINRGDPDFTGPPDSDQRGVPFARKVGARIDIGAFESDVLNVLPTVADIGPLAVPDHADSTIELRNSFDDAEDGAAGLVYTVIGTSNPALFASTSVDDATDVLTLDGAEGAEGVATLTVRGTDSGGLFVEQTFDVIVGANVVVNSAADDVTPGDGLTTLREAITAANTNSDANTITFDLGPGAHTINLAAWLPDLSSDMSIQGPGSELLTVRRDTADSLPIFTIGGDATVHLADMTISNGAWYDGGGVRNFGAATITRCVVADNWGYYAGGIFNSGALVITDSNISDNADYSALVGGIYNASGQLTINGSTISGNAGYAAGGICSEWGSLTISNSTISGNAGFLCGAVGGYVESLALHNSTVAGNTSETFGGVFVQVSASSDISNSILAQNINGDLFIGAFDGAVATVNHNFIGDDNPGVDPLLGCLADNGGPTKTMAVLPGSPCINGGDPDFTSPPNLDQRGAGFDRVAGGRIDIGAFEYNAAPTTRGILDLSVPEDATNSLINLRTSFDDTEDGPAGLVYTIVGNTNPALFATASIDSATDLLTLDYADDANGVASITIRATDSQGLFVEDTFIVTVVSVQKQALRLQQSVKSLLGLSAGNTNALLVKLNLKGNSDDLAKVNSFIALVNDFVKAGKITKTAGERLMSAAHDLLVSLG